MHWLSAVVFILAACQTVTSQSQVCNQFGCGPPAPLTVADKLAWLNNHNQVRCQANAQTMPALIWDDALEKTAQEWANTCPQGHNEPAGSGTGRVARFNFFSGMSVTGVGENYAAGQSDYIACDNDWASEKPQMGGHYTQMVWAGTTRVGCAKNTVACSGFGYYYICDYYPPGNYIGQKPFVAGSGTTNTEACQQQNHAGDLPTYMYSGGTGSVVNVPVTGGGVVTPTNPPGGGGGGSTPTQSGGPLSPGTTGGQAGATQPPPNTSSSKQDPTGTIVGAVIGVCVGTAVIGGIIYYFYQRRQSSMKWSSSKTHIDNYQVDRKTPAASPSSSTPSPTTNNYTPAQVPSHNITIQANQPPSSTWNGGNHAGGAAPIAGGWSHHQKHPSLDNYQPNPVATPQPSSQQGVRSFQPQPMIPSGPPVPSSRPMVPQSRPQPQGSPRTQPQSSPYMH